MAAGAELIAVSVDSQVQAAAIVQQHGLEFPVLYDEDTTVTREWGIFNLLNDNVSAPATYVFNASGELAAYRIGENIADRPAAAEVVNVLSRP